MKNYKFAFFVLLVSLTVIGTVGGRLSGVTPFYNEKGGFSFGINLGAYTEFSSGSEHQGINISFLTRLNPGSSLKGLNLSVITYVNKNAKIDGANISLLGTSTDKENQGGEVNGLEIGLLNSDSRGDFYGGSARKINGLQIGVLNWSLGNRSFKTCQLGFFNRIHYSNGNSRDGFIINW